LQIPVVIGLPSNISSLGRPTLSDNYHLKQIILSIPVAAKVQALTAGWVFP
jgi:hypothetical protein